MDCICERGWICEEHPELPWPHGDCPGPGMPCAMPDCPWWQGVDPIARDQREWDTIYASTREDHREPS